MSRPQAPTPAQIRQALGAFFDAPPAAVRPLGNGLINETYRVDAGDESFVLQRLHPVFSPEIHDNIDTVTRRLAAAGLTTPRLVPTRDGGLYAGLPDGPWRLQTFIVGHTFDTVESPAQAAEAGRLVGHFHRALEGIEHRFVGTRTGVHDTPAHLRRLAAAVRDLPEHRLAGPIAELSARIFAAAKELPPLPETPTCIGHGDLKISNFLFEGEGERAICLVDLDTVGPIALAHEMGDAWRSWCATGPEDTDDLGFDLEIYGRSLTGYVDGLGRRLTEAEGRALLSGVEWVSLELAARFAADALLETYFGWDAARYPAAGEHHLARARGQWALHGAVVGVRKARKTLFTKMIHGINKYG